jgi:hypothetical protein
MLGALALMFAGAAAAQPDGEGGRGMVRKACMADIEQFCGSIEPGGGRLGQCLREHQDRVSDTCKNALSSARQGRRERQTQTPAPAPQPPTSSGPG